MPKRNKTLTSLVADEPLETAFDALRTFDWGQNPEALKPIDDAVIGSHGDAAAQKALAARLAAVLGADLPKSAKVFVCRKLSVIGSAESTKALVSLLTDHDLSHMARYALERMACPEAGRALRDALPKTKGKLKIGMINSLGVRRDVRSTDALIALLNASDQKVAGAAAAALGDIGTPEAARALGAFQSKAPKSLRLVVADACLACAEQLVADGKRAEAGKVYKSLSTSGQPKHVRAAAKRGLKAARPERSEI